MSSYLMKRLGTIVPTLLFVSMLIFGLQQLLPGDPAKVLAGEDQDPTVVAYLTQKMHLDKPLPVRYVYWLGGVLTGDLGESLRMQKPVTALIAEKLPVTIELALLAFLIALAIGIPAGIASAIYKNTWLDYVANGVALWGLSTPNFWLGIMLILLVSVQLGWLPASGYVSPFEDLKGNLAAMRFVAERTCGRAPEASPEAVPLDFTLPKLQSVANCTAAIDRLADAITQGTVDRDTAKMLLEVITARMKAIEMNDLEARLTELEKAAASVDLPGSRNMRRL